MSKEMDVTSQNHISATFGVPGKTTVKTTEDFEGAVSGGEEGAKTVTIVDLELGATFEWVALPRKVESVYLNARVRNDSDYQLLSGSVAVYFDSSFVANSTLADVTPGGKFLIHLGVDNSIKISYPPQSKKLATSGLLSKTKTHAYSQRITVQNNKPKPITNLTIIDHIPVSENANINVKLIKPSLPVWTVSDVSELKKWVGVGNGLWSRWASLEGNEEELSDAKGEGKLEWKCELEAGKQTTLVTEWQVSASANEQIVGLEN